ncbi:hypothetical protein PHMEG_00012056 [Phytophthora megakarya]|uniref:Uncharacterized protein n=1 Tax=Phytophthora megakarya TaxID=4795 RepID=A0A225W9P9_9STRA|nr:hypothetical protein PHMEG_00012056 [Phytophthora megakarya]
MIVFYQFFFLISMFISICHGWKVRIYSGGKSTDPSKKFSFSTAQRCFSLSSCWDNKSRAADWSGIPSDARIVFYASSECQGRYAIGEAKSSGEIDFVPAHLSGDVSSFMVWQSGMYATAGFKDLCFEKTTVNSLTELRNTTGSSEYILSPA